MGCILIGAVLNLNFACMTFWVLMGFVFRQVCADTIVGSQMVRGISGGQRKRVTTGEMVVGPMKTLFLVSPSQQCSSTISHAFQLIQPQ